MFFFFFFSSRRRHTRCLSDWSSDVCSSDLVAVMPLVDVPREDAGAVALAWSLRECARARDPAVADVEPVALDEPCRYVSHRVSFLPEALRVRSIIHPTQVSVEKSSFSLGSGQLASGVAEERELDPAYDGPPLLRR